MLIKTRSNEVRSQREIIQKVTDSIRGLKIESITLTKSDISELYKMTIHDNAKELTDFLNLMGQCMHVPQLFNEPEPVDEANRILKEAGKNYLAYINRKED